MAGKRKVHTPEFKLQAVKIITEQKLSVAETTRRLGVAENLFHSWKKAVLKKGIDALPGSGHLTPIEEEMGEAATEAGVAPRRISFTGALKILRCRLSECPAD